MRKQINIALILGFLFIVWLFLHTFMGFYSRNERLGFEKTKHLYKRLRQKDEGHYSIIDSDIGLIIYDENTGESWRYFRELTEEGEFEFKEEGWTPLIYSFGEGAEGITPEIALQNFKEFLKKKNQKDKNKQKRKLKDDLGIFGKGEPKEQQEIDTTGLKRKKD